MGDIYREAVAVIVDLGEKIIERDDILLGIELLRKLAQIPPTLFKPGKDNMIAPWEFEKFSLPCGNDMAWQALGAIFLLP